MKSGVPHLRPYSLSAQVAVEPRERHNGAISAELIPDEVLHADGSALDEQPPNRVARIRRSLSPRPRQMTWSHRRTGTSRVVFIQGHRVIKRSGIGASASGADDVLQLAETLVRGADQLDHGRSHSNGQGGVIHHVPTLTCCDGAPTPLIERARPDPRLRPAHREAAEQQEPWCQELERQGHGRWPAR